MPRKQCRTCPWRADADPHAIPNYQERLHRSLGGTIADPGNARGLGGALRIMACHYSPAGAEVPCVGWLVNQLGTGNNLPLRLAVITGRIDGNVEIDGGQHATLEATFPKTKIRRAR
jgi:hypothetical protein